MEKTWKRVCEHAPASSVARDSWEQDKRVTYREREFKKRRQKRRRQKTTTRERQNGEKKKKNTEQNHHQQLCPLFKHVETLRLQITETVCLVCVPLKQAHVFWDVPVVAKAPRALPTRHGWDLAGGSSP